jgi:hypothetical protein
MELLYDARAVLAAALLWQDAAAGGQRFESGADQQHQLQKFKGMKIKMN